MFSSNKTKHFSKTYQQRKVSAPISLSIRVQKRFILQKRIDFCKRFYPQKTMFLQTQVSRKHFHGAQNMVAV